MTDTNGRSPAQFFFEIGYGACWAEAFVRKGEKAPFKLTDAMIERAWQIAPEAHDDPAEFDSHLALASNLCESEVKPAGTNASALVAAVKDYMVAAGVPLTEFDPEFVVKMVSAMMVSFHKYGRVTEAYPAKFSATDDVRARMAKYRETGNKHFLVDVANFAMIEAMHTARAGASWGSNDAADSPGRTSNNGRRLVHEDNHGGRIMGETILHHPGAIS